MDVRHERHQVVAPAGLRDGTSQSAIAPPERVLGGGKPDSESTLARPVAFVGPQRSTLAEIGKRLGSKALAPMACVARPDTILAWYRRLIAGGSMALSTRRYANKA
jgi:hypothetical protein